MSRNNTKDNVFVAVEQMLPYQDWSYVEVVRDFHKHFGTNKSRAHIKLLNDTVKPFKKLQCDEQSALRWLSLASFGGLITPLCQRALELVRDHKLKEQVAKRKPAETLKAEEDTNAQPCKKAPPTNAPSSVPEAKSGVDMFVEAIYGGRKTFDELLNDFFGFDINEAKGMSTSEFGEYYTLCKKMGWKNASKKA